MFWVPEQTSTFLFTLITPQHIDCKPNVRVITDTNIKPNCQEGKLFLDRDYLNDI